MGNIVRGGAWTTDAPFRETAEAVAFAESEHLSAVEMEAAGLCAFAEAQRRDVLCFARVTNRMATVENGFEKGEGSGNTSFLALLQTVADAREAQKACGSPGRTPAVSWLARAAEFRLLPAQRAQLSSGCYQSYAGS